MLSFDQSLPSQGVVFNCNNVDARVKARSRRRVKDILLDLPLVTEDKDRWSPRLYVSLAGAGHK